MLFKLCCPSTIVSVLFAMLENKMYACMYLCVFESAFRAPPISGHPSGVIDITRARDVSVIATLIKAGRHCVTCDNLRLDAINFTANDASRHELKKNMNGTEMMKISNFSKLIHEVNIFNSRQIRNNSVIMFSNYRSEDNNITLLSTKLQRFSLKSQ